MSTSRKADVDNLADAHTMLEPLGHMPVLSDRARDYFDSYSQGKALTDWFEHEIIIISQLARLSTVVDTLLDDVETTGTTILNARGVNITNPNLTALQKAMGLELSAIRALRLAVKEGREKRTKRSDISKRSDKQKDARVVKFDKGNLLAKPD